MKAHEPIAWNTNRYKTRNSDQLSLPRIWNNNQTTIKNNKTNSKKPENKKQISCIQKQCARYRVVHQAKEGKAKTFGAFYCYKEEAQKTID